MVYFLPMPSRTEASPHKHESHLHPEGIPVEVYADAKIRVYKGHHPRTVVDIPELKTHITILKFDPFEFNRVGEIDHIVVRKEHHKGEYALGFNISENAGPYEYEAWAADGVIGFAYGKRLDLLIASLFYTDPKLNELIKDAGLDESVRKYLDFSVISAGKHRYSA